MKGIKVWQPKTRLFWGGTNENKTEDEQGNGAQDNHLESKNVTLFRSGGFDKEAKTVKWGITNFSEIGEVSEAVGLQNITFEMGTTLKLPSKFKVKLSTHECKECKDVNDERESWLDQLMSDASDKYYLNVGISAIGKIYHPHLFTKVKVAIYTKNKEAQSIIRRSKTIDLGSSSSNPDIKSIEFKDFVELSTILDPKMGLMDECGTLHIEVETTVFKFHEEAIRVGEDATEFYNRLEAEHKERSRTHALDHLKELATFVAPSWTFPDALLQSINDVGFPVHKGILSARSPFFKNAFQDRAQPDPSNNEFKLLLTSDALEILLQHLYTGELQKEWLSSPAIHEVLTGAREFASLHLIQFCDEMIHLAATRENIDMLQKLAETHHLQTAKENLGVLKNKIVAEDASMGLASTDQEDLSNRKSI